MAATKKSTKIAKKTVQSRAKKGAKRRVAKNSTIPTVSEVSKQANKTKSSNIGVIILIFSVISLAVFAATTLGDDNKQFEELRVYDSAGISVKYPTDWNSSVVSGKIEFFSDEKADESDSGLIVDNTGAIPGYKKLKESQKEELVELAAESVRESDDSLKADFESITDSKVEVSEHQSAESAIYFEFHGKFKHGGEGSLIGYALILESGDTYVLSTGGNSEVYEANKAVYLEMLNSFRVESN